MRNSILSTKIMSFVLLCIGFNFLTSCNDETGTTTVPLPTITATAQATPALSTLVTALTRADLATTLNAAGTYTVFAPTNDAFNAYFASISTPGGTPVTVNNVDIPTLKQILLNHVIGTTLTAEALPNKGYIKTLAKGFASSTNTLSMFIDKTTGVRINGVSSVNLSSYNISASNGVVHVVNSVIPLPTIVTHAIANTNFSKLVTIVTSTPTNGNGFGDQTAVATALTTNTTPLTVFAPTNAAFDTATAAGAWANGATPVQVTKVLQYHVTSALGGNVLSTALTQGLVVPMITTPVLNTTVDLVGGVKIKDTQSATAGYVSSNVIAADVQCANGVIHGIDKVLRPTF